MEIETENGSSGWCANLHLFTFQKHQDVFASSFGFFLLGFDVISKYGSPQHIPVEFFGITDPVLWFFKVRDSLLQMVPADCLRLILPALVSPCLASCSVY